MAGMPSISELDNEPTDPRQILRGAVQAHQSGDLNRARELYLKASADTAISSTCMLYLGAICLQQKDYSGACDFFSRVSGQEADSPMLQINYGVALLESGQPELALGYLTRGVELDPNSTEAQYNVARCLQSLNRFGQAATRYETLLQINPSDSQGWCLYGGCLAFSGKCAQALEALKKSFDLSGESLLLRFYSGVCWEGLTNFTEAAANYNRALQMDPSDTRFMLGLARTLSRVGQFDQALHYCEMAEKAAGENAVLCTTFSAVYLMQSQYAKGIEYAHKAIGMSPASGDACGLLAYGLGKTGEAQQAEEWYTRACELSPQNPQHFLNRSANHAARGMPQLALESAYKALELAPQNAAAFSNVLLYLHYPDTAEQSDIFSLHKRWGEMFSVTPADNPAADRKPEAIRRIGFLSGDLRRHSVAFFILPLLRELQKSGIECYLYSNNPFSDSISEHMKQLGSWNEIRYMDDDSAYELMCSHELDALVELNGHTDNNRLQLFSRKPAPLCVSWLGYPDTTGIAGTYRITDPIADPEGEDQYYTETLLRMPQNFLCFEAPPFDLTPAVYDGKPEIVFGSFNNLSKISDSCMKVWAEILKNVPQSCLLLKSRGLEDQQAQQRISDFFSAEGIGADRLSLAPAVKDYAEHIQTYNEVDIALDTFPYNGTTTTCEALWMARPVITLAGTHHRSRVGSSIVQSSGLGEFSVTTAEEYVNKAVQLARSPEKIIHFHQTIRSTFLSSPVCNAAQFSADFLSTLENARKTL